VISKIWFSFPKIEKRVEFTKEKKFKIFHFSFNFFILRIWQFFRGKKKVEFTLGKKKIPKISHYFLLEK
jgi:hypothetical protein